MMIATEAKALAEGCVTTWAGITRVVASSTGIREVYLPDWHEQVAQDARNLHKTVQPEMSIERNASSQVKGHLRAALDQLAEYFAGERRVFTVPLDLQGTDFFRTVWAEVARIPYGETCSYAEVARAVGAPRAVRAVGAANGANPVAPFVPCHRVVGSDGRLTGYGPGLPLKATLLAMEDAVPAAPEDYAAWVARIGERLGIGSEQFYLGMRGLGVYCRPDCPRETQQRFRPARIFRTAEEATQAGFTPCAFCQPRN